MPVVYLLCGPAGSGKTRWLLDRYRTANRDHVGGALWIGPTQRNLDAVRARLLTTGRAMLAPNLVTFQDLADAVVRNSDPMARPLSDLQRRLLADDVMADLHSRGELHHFQAVVDTRGFAEGAVALLAELKHNEIPPADLLRVVYRREDPVRPKDFDIAHFYEQYQGLLAEHQLYDKESRLWYARDLLRRGVRRPFAAVRTVFVAGFGSFTRTEQEILIALADGVEEMVLALPDEVEQDRAELFALPRAAVQRLQFGPETILYRVNTDKNRRTDRPAGLAHVERQLFRPLRAVERSPDAAGISRIEAPGLLGEARMVARAVKQRLLSGLPAGEVLVTARDLKPYWSLLLETFGEYGIPADAEGAQPLAHSPPVATVLRCWRLADEDFPFAGVTALLRSSYFRPNWPEIGDDPTLVQHAEALLRLLAEPRNRESTLRAVDRWADDPPRRLEDEDAEESRFRRMHLLALKCRPFLQRFFRTWDGQPINGTLAEHAAWLRRFIADIGVSRAVEAEDGAAWQRFHDEIAGALRILQALPTAGRLRGRLEFGRFLAAVAAQAGLARTPRGPGRVRILSAERASTIDADSLFVLGLGERSFPNLASESLFDEADRAAFRQGGLDFPCMADRLPEEMLLFYRLVTRPRKQLVLSYPAVDGKGLELLPSSFLVTLLGCFSADAVPVERRRMLIEQLDKDPPLCPAEARVRLARARNLDAALLTPDLADNLQAAARIAQRRFDETEYNIYDGKLRHPAVLAELERRWGPNRVFSPTALENYIACPFRFFMQHLLRLETLEEPSAEVEQAHRGTTVHRAMSRLHIELQKANIDLPDDDLLDRVLAQLRTAVTEAIGQAPSPAAKVLWEIEARRLEKKVGRYPEQWQKFLDPWLKLQRKVQPRPGHFEVSFGLRADDGTMSEPLLIAHDGVEVRLGGRIDRVDETVLDDGVGFWVIDYKTGNPANYQGSHLESMERVQLTLYALAVEQVLHAGKAARPLGLAYWMVTDAGLKPALPGWRQPTAWRDDRLPWQTFRERLRSWVVALANGIRGGDFFLAPRSERCTETCDYSQVCRIAQSRGAVARKTGRLELPMMSNASLQREEPPS